MARFTKVFETGAEIATQHTLMWKNLRIENFKMTNDVHKKFVSPLASFTAENLISRLDLLTLKPKVIVDLSGDTQCSAPLLKKHYSDAEVITTGDRVQLPVSSLPFENHGVDFIFANLVLPWCVDWEAILREWRRVLKPEGLLMFSCLGLDTLALFTEKDCILPRLIDMHEVGDLIVNAKFADPVLDVEHVTFTYQDEEKFLYELQMDRILSPDFLKNENIPDPLSVAYEIIYGHAFGPPETVDFVADETGVVKIPLDHLRSRRILR